MTKLYAVFDIEKDEAGAIRTLAAAPSKAVA
jgi:hypothetical protein